MARVSNTLYLVCSPFSAGIFCHCGVLQIALSTPLSRLSSSKSPATTGLYSRIGASRTFTYFQNRRTEERFLQMSNQVQLNTVRCRYIGQLSPNSSQQTHHSSPVRAIQIQILIYFLPQKLEYCVQYHVILNRNITTLDCISVAPLSYLSVKVVLKKLYGLFHWPWSNPVQCYSWDYDDGIADVAINVGKWSFNVLVTWKCWNTCPYCRWICRHRCWGYDQDLMPPTLQWRHNGCDRVSNHQSHVCLLNR